MSESNPIERSFEIAAERCEDITPLVYHRLHPEYPETLTMFRTEGSEPVKGSMLALTIDAILDFVGPRTGHFPHDRMRDLLARRLRHAARSVHRVLRLIARTLREILGDDWSPEIDAAWRNLLGEIEALVAQTAPAYSALSCTASRSPARASKQPANWRQGQPQRRRSWMDPPARCGFRSASRA